MRSLISVLLVQPESDRAGFIIGPGPPIVTIHPVSADTTVEKGLSPGAIWAVSDAPAQLRLFLVISGLVDGHRAK
jgi:hypothetical protein